MTEFVQDTFDYSATYSDDTVCALCHGGISEVSANILTIFQKLKCFQGQELHHKLSAISQDILNSDSDDSDVETTENTLDPSCVWMAKHPLINGGKRTFVHFYCALYSPASWLKGKRWFNVTKETRRASCFKCCHCGLKGAGIGCLRTRCHYVVHLPCAMEQGWNPSLMHKSSFMCPSHSQAEIDTRHNRYQYFHIGNWLLKELYSNV